MMSNRISISRATIVIVVVALWATNALAQSTAKPKGQGPAAQIQQGQPADDQASAESALIDELIKKTRMTEAPGSPAEVKSLVHAVDAFDGASTRPAPKFAAGTARVTGAPGAKIPTVYLELTQPTAVTFVDRSGAPWPILVCDASAGFVANPPPKGSHVQILTPKTTKEHGALVCSLDGHTNPITLLLEAGQGTANPSFIAQVDEMGPHGKPPLYERPRQALAAGDDILQSLLYGVSPEGAVRLKISGGGTDTQAWRYKGSLYIRTPLTLWSPAPLDEIRQTDVNVYRLDPMPLIRLSDNGTALDIHVEGARVIGPNEEAIKQASGAIETPRPLSLSAVITRTEP
jgi:intracellular multiplication protein IcmK